MPKAAFTRRALLAAFLFVTALAGPAFCEEKPVQVFAAASLKEVLTRVAEDWKAESGKPVVLTFAASSALAKQIEQGAPADLFLSADLKWMDYLEKAGLLKSESRVTLLSNRLVLVGGPDAKDVTVGKDLDLAAMLGEGRLAVGLTASVPAGLYAKQALESLGLFAAVKDRLAEAENVRAALTLVARGEAPYGVVYETDAKAEKGVRQIGIFPEDSHDPIVYPAALTQTAEGPDAAAFLAYLGSEKAGKVFAAAGFRVLSGK